MISFGFNISEETQKKMTESINQIAERLMNFKLIVIGSYNGIFDNFIILSQNHNIHNVVSAIEKEKEKLNFDIEKEWFYAFPKNYSLSELLGVTLIGKEYPKEICKTAQEIIEAKKHKKPFYKKLSKLKKWEQ